MTEQKKPAAKEFSTPVVYRNRTDEELFSGFYGATEIRDGVYKMLEQEDIRERLAQREVITFRSSYLQNSVIAKDFKGKELSRAGKVHHSLGGGIEISARTVTPKWAKIVFQQEDFLMSKDMIRARDEAAGKNRIELSISDESRKKLTELYYNKVKGYAPLRVGNMARRGTRYGKMTGNALSPGNWIRTGRSAQHLPAPRFQNRNTKGREI